MNDVIKIGISSCLLGNNVRYDGGHKWDRFLTDTLGRYVEYVPVCPEVECGLGIPREAMRLVGDEHAPKLMTIRSKSDLTEKMMGWAKIRVVELEKEALCGFIFKTNSPSSGMVNVKVYNENGIPAKKGIGIFARAFMEHFPLLPVEDDGRLHDVHIRENFIARIFVFNRWRDVLKQGKSMGRIVDFHTRHKMIFLSHNPKYYQMMGKLVAQSDSLSIDDRYDQYQVMLSKSLRLLATPAKHSNVLQHAMGYFKKQLTSDEKQELNEIIDHYREGIVPLIVPITLINHYIRKYDQSYLRQQYYLNPYPAELQLRNHV